MQRPQTDRADGRARIDAGGERIGGELPRAPLAASLPSFRAEAHVVLMTWLLIVAGRVKVGTKLGRVPKPRIRLRLVKLLQQT